MTEQKDKNDKNKEYRDSHKEKAKLYHKDIETRQNGT